MSLCAKKKGFTLVELSIVMAVVIILASVSIVTFTKVIKAAKESAAMQEMKQRKEELMLEDILHINSDDWLSVDELEEETISEVAQITEEHGKDKFADEMFENTLGEIISKYVIASVNGQTKMNPTEAVYIINEAIKETNSPFTEKDISQITGRYITDGEIKGDYSWYDNKQTMIIGEDKKQAADQMTALSVLSKCGMDFSGKTIVLKGEIDLRGEEFTPIVSFSGKMIGEENKIIMEYQPKETTIKGMNGAVVSDYMTYDPRRPKVRSDIVSYGFVGLLSEGASIKNVNFELDMKYRGSVFKNTYIGGVVGCLDGGEISDCSITGNVSGYCNVGGIVGYAKSGTIKNLKIQNLTVNAYTDSEIPYAGGIAAYIYSGTVNIENCNIKNTKICAYTKNNVLRVSSCGTVAGVIGPLNAKTDTLYTTVNMINVRYDDTTITSNTKNTKNIFSKKGYIKSKCTVNIR